MPNTFDHKIELVFVSRFINRCTLFVEMWCTEVRKIVRGQTEMWTKVVIYWMQCTSFFVARAIDKQINLVCALRLWHISESFNMQCNRSISVQRTAPFSSSLMQFCYGKIAMTSIPYHIYCYFCETYRCCLPFRRFSAIWSSWLSMISWPIYMDAVPQYGVPRTCNTTFPLPLCVVSCGSVCFFSKTFPFAFVSDAAE